MPEPRIYRMRRPAVASPSVPEMPLRISSGWFTALGKFLSKVCWIFAYPFLWLNVRLSRQQPIYGLAKLPADRQKDRRPWFLFSALQS